MGIEEAGSVVNEEVMGFQGQDAKDPPAVVPEEIVLTRIWPNPSTGDVGIEF